MTTTPATPTTKDHIRWRLVILLGLLSGLAWTGIIVGSSISGIGWLAYLVAVPAMIAGIYVGRKITGRPLVNGLILGGFAFLGAFATATPIVLSSNAFKSLTTGANGQSMTVTQALLSLISQMVITLVMFAAYGVLMSFNGMKRNKEYREEMDRRGGSLQRPGRVTNLLDLQLLALPKFASWVLQLFRANGFKLDDYRITKEHIDLFVIRNEGDERWLVRCVSDESVKSGQIQALDQEIRSNGDFVKAVLITSRGVHDGARKWVKNRTNLELLDGETLWEMNS